MKSNSWPVNKPDGQSPAQQVFEQGRIARQGGDLAAAQGYFREAMRLEPSFVPAYNNLANLLQGDGQITEAIELYEQALQFAPQQAALHCNLASLWQMQGQSEQAITGYRRAIDLKPNFFIAHHNLGKVLRTQGQFAAALLAYQAALGLQPEAAEVYLDLGDLYQQQGLVQEAIDCYKAAVRCEPSAHAYTSLGTALQTWGEVRISRAAFVRALELDPNYEAAHFSLAQSLEGAGELVAAQQHYERSISLRPEGTNVLFYLNHLRLKLADWDNYAERLTELIAGTTDYLGRPGTVGLPALSVMAFPLSIELQSAISRHLAKSQAELVKTLRAELAPVGQDLAPARLKIGYVSPDFRCHAVGTLIYQMFQYHQRPDFEVFAYSLVPTVDDWTQVIQQGCDHYIDVSCQSPLQIAQRIQADGIHILIDLAGFTGQACPALLALQAAPIQVQYMGYPGTMGADYIQYIVADEQIIPAHLAHHYSEEVIYLPQAWVASPMEIAPLVTTRADWGLPEKGMVFCCFNGTYKIDPQVFGAWMKILLGVSGSVLWLSDGGEPLIVERLRQRAIEWGVDPVRLVFGANLPHGEYLARYQLADLFLDTFTYNAGATAVGALWAGLPVLTCPGEVYVARMGASLCAAVGLPELICGSVDQYVQRAIELGNKPEKMRALQEKLVSSLVVAPLFQPQVFVQNLEVALREIWQRFVN